MKVNSFQQQTVRGFVHEPSGHPTAGLVLTHGAGSNSESPLLVAVATAFCETGLLVLRCDLPFRQKRRFGPPAPAHAAEDQAGLADAAAILRQMISGPLFLGGHSYGGRQATLLASTGEQSADALLLLSYPLHPPAQPQRLRTSHWPSLRTASFFVHGTNDPFGSIDEMQSALPLIGAPGKLITLDKAGHDLARGKFPIQKLVIDPFLAFAGPFAAMRAVT